MVKEKRILSYFIGWLLLGFIVCFVGINKIFALTTTEYEDITYLNNYTVYYVKADYASSPLQLQPTNEYQLDQVTGFLVNIDNYSFNAGVTYNIEISMPLNTLTNANKYTVTGDNNMTCSVTQIDNTNPNFPNFTFNCPNNTRNITLNIFNSNGNYIVNTGLFRWNYTFLRKQITTLDLGILENQQSQIIDQNNQIIQGQDDIQNSINDNLNSCRDSYNLLSLRSGTYSNNGLTAVVNNGEVVINGTSSDIAFIGINVNPVNLIKGKKYTISLNNNIVLSDVDALRLNGSTTNQIGFNQVNRTKTITQVEDLIMTYVTIRISSGITLQNFVFKPQLQEGSIATKWEPYGEEICSNKIDETNDKLDNLTGAITDSSSPNTSGLNNSAGWLPAGPLDSVLNLPLSLFNALTTNLNKSCNPINIPLPFVNKNITLPCINTLYNQIGITSFLSWIGVIVSGLMLYTYLLKLYKWIEDRITLNETHNVDSWGGL